MLTEPLCPEIHLQNLQCSVMVTQGSGSCEEGVSTSTRVQGKDSTGQETATAGDLDGSFLWVIRQIKELLYWLISYTLSWEIMTWAPMGTCEVSVSFFKKELWIISATLSRQELGAQTLTS